MEANPNILAEIDLSFLLNPPADDDNDDEALTNPTADEPAHSDTTTPTTTTRQPLPQPEAIQLREAVSKATKEWLDQRPVFDGNKDDPRETAYYFSWEPKIVIHNHPKVPNMIILTINKEDYTLGGLITEALKRDDRVVFAACKVCHPHECRVDVYMATLGGVDGRKVLKDTVLGLVRMTEKFRMKVTHEFELYKMVQLGKEEAARAVAQTQEGRPKEQSGQEKQGENEKEEEEEQTGETGAEAEGEAERETDLFAQELDI